ncbi:MAG: response regulator [Nitrospira sp.]|nr:response regulator [Candidatus Brocadiales bacterium]MBL7048434.1 response regulator [Nitrospira sp.]
MKTGLVIEDNEDNMVLITRILKKSGYGIVEATTGLMGVDIALQKQVDFIILDIQLPDIDGTEVLHRIREAEEGRGVRIIAMTSYAMSGDREKLLAAGCDGYIEKPIDPERVISQIQDIIDI